MKVVADRYAPEVVRARPTDPTTAARPDPPPRDGSNEAHEGWVNRWEGDEREVMETSEVVGCKPTVN